MKLTAGSPHYHFAAPDVYSQTTPCAYKRLMSQRMLDKKEDVRAHFVEKMLDNKHAELAPPCDKDKERWYLPTFGIYHPEKPGKICVVFDSSAKFDGVSLNNVLISGPDVNNTLNSTLQIMCTMVLVAK